MKRIDQIDIERCSETCDSLPCLYFNFKRSKKTWHPEHGILQNTNYGIPVGACSLFGRDYEPQLTYCWKKGIAYLHK